MKINVPLKQKVEKYCLIDNFKHISRYGNSDMGGINHNYVAIERAEL